MLKTIETSTEGLNFYYKNPRIGNVKAIAESLRVSGQYRAIVVNEGTLTGRPMEVLAGNHTLKAARELGWEKITAHLLDVDEEQAAKIVLADNRTAELGGMDEDALFELLATLESLEGTGYTQEDLDLLDPAGDEELLTGDDDLPETTTPRARPGEVWVLGDHRVVCGDATDPAAYQALLQGEEADVIWTDPPYGVSYVGKTKDALTIQNDGAQGLAGLLNDSFPLLYKAVRPGAAFYVAHADTERLTFETALADAGFTIRQNLVWVKNTIVLGRSDYHYKHEPILYGFKPAGKGYGRLGRGGKHWAGTDAEATAREATEDVLAAIEGEGEERAMLIDLGALQKAAEDIQKRSTVLRYDKPAASRQHPTMKPVALVADTLRNSARRGDTVLDIFGGSGSTLIAAQKLGLKARLIELDPRFIDVIVARWEEATGGTAYVEQAAKSPAEAGPAEH